MKNLNEMTDEELALSYINGNNRAFDLLLSHNQSKLFSYILFVVRNRDVADDIFQETFVKIIEEKDPLVLQSCSYWVPLVQQLVEGHSM